MVLTQTFLSVELLELGKRVEVDLKVNTIKILGIHFSYNNKLYMDKKLLTAISNIQNILNVWRTRNFTLEGKITVFKIFALSKTVHLCLTSIVPTQIIEKKLKYT